VPATAVEGRAADDDGGDGVELIAEARVGCGRVEPGRDEQPGHGGQATAERVNPQLDAIDEQAAEQRRSLIPADRVVLLR
jgi:hypothetical protein